MLMFWGDVFFRIDRNPQNIVNDLIGIALLCYVMWMFEVVSIRADSHGEEFLWTHFSSIAGPDELLIAWPAKLSIAGRAKSHGEEFLWTHFSSIAWPAELLIAWPAKLSIAWQAKNHGEEFLWTRFSSITFGPADQLIAWSVALSTARRAESHGEEFLWTQFWSTTSSPHMLGVSFSRYCVHFAAFW